MPLDDTLNDGQSHAVIPDEVGFRAAIVRAADLNPRLVGLTAEFDRIGNQIDENLPDQSRVGFAVGQVTD